MKFKVGDRVKVVAKSEGANEVNIGDVGTIKYVAEARKDCLPYAVEFDNGNSAYHTVGGRCKNYHGYWCSDNMLKPVENSKLVVVIYRENQKVIALDKSSGKKAIARCCPEDTFDFYTGAQLAFDRLVDMQRKSEVYNGKIVFGKNIGMDFRAGKVYEIKDGYIESDTRRRFLLFGPFRSIDDVKRYFGGEGINNGGRFRFSNKISPVMEIEND